MQGNRSSCLLQLVLLLAVCEARGAVFNIANGDVAGLKSAITTAGSNNQDDTINLASGGSYQVNTVDNTSDGSNGLPVLQPDGGHTITINGNGATISLTTDSSSNFRALAVHGNAVLSQIIFQGGFPGQNSNGGIIKNTTATLTVSNCSLLNGSTVVNGPHNADGAAISNDTGTLIIDTCVFSDNQSNGNGTVLNNLGTLTVTNSTFYRNKVHYGGGIYNDGNGTATVSGCTFNANYQDAVPNEAYTGGGVYNAGTITLSGCTFAGNSVQGNGGALYNLDGTATVQNCTFSANQAYSGGVSIMAARPEMLLLISPPAPFSRILM